MPRRPQKAKAKAEAAATGEVAGAVGGVRPDAEGAVERVIGAAEAMPADKYDFAPTAGNFAGVRTFGSEVQHLVQANYFFFSGFGLSGAPDQAKLKALKSKDELVQALKDSFDLCAEGHRYHHAAECLHGIGSGPANMKMTRAGAATFCLAHSMDHYGQMVEYLRMNGIVPPASQKQAKGGGQRLTLR